MGSGLGMLRLGARAGRCGPVGGRSWPYRWCRGGARLLLGVFRGADLGGKTGELLGLAAQLSTGAEKVNHLSSFHIERLMHWCARRSEGCSCEE